MSKGHHRGLPDSRELEADVEACPAAALVEDITVARPESKDGGLAAL